MKKIFITAVIAMAIGVAAGALLFRHPVATPEGGGAERRVLYYRNPMNPEMTSPEPRKAPDGMDYVPVYDEPQAASGERPIAYWQDPMHPWYTSDKPGKAPDCGMDLVPVYAGDDQAAGIKIDPTMVQNMGVREEAVGRRRLTRTIRTSGVVDYDETRLFTVTTKFMGWVEKLHVDYTGRMVNQGAPLLEIYSPELVTTQEEYLQALRYRERLANSSLETARAEAEELLRSVRQRLGFWDIPAREIEALEQRGSAARAVTIVSPAAGVVTEKMVIAGQQVMAGMALYRIADLSTVWVLADIYQYELGWIRVGQPAALELSYLSGAQLKGTITYIDPFLNPETRTVRVRIAVRNTPERTLKPGMFATVRIVSAVARDALALPEQAVIRSGERTIAVVALGNGYFDPREVRLGAAADGFIEVLEGLHEGEKIVTSAQFLIDSESNLKAAVAGMARSPGAEAEDQELENALQQETMDKPPSAAGDTAPSAGHNH